MPRLYAKLFLSTHLKEYAYITTFLSFKLQLPNMFLIDLIKNISFLKMVDSGGSR